MIRSRPSSVVAVAAALATLALAALAFADRADAYVYWANGGTGSIGRANLDGSGANQSFITGANNPQGVAVNGSHVHWVNGDTFSIRRADLDGNNVEQNFITTLADPAGVAVSGSHVYWTNTQLASIGRATLDGSGASQLFIGGAVALGVAVNDSYVYWTNNSGTIGRADLDGSGVNQSFITGASFPSGVAVDDSHVYWTNPGSNSIGRADLPDGDNVDHNFITGASGPYMLAVDDSHVYWTNPGSNSIGRADLPDGDNVDHNFITGISFPTGLAVDGLEPPNQAPTADAGPDQTVASEASVGLDAGGSSDPDNDPLDYAWTQTSGPQINLSGQNSATPSFGAPIGPAVLEFEVEVCDPEPLCDTDSVVITVEVPTVDEVIDSIEALGLPKGTENSLVKKLENAQKSLDKGDTDGACEKLASFIDEVEAQRGKKIDDADADALVARVEAISEAEGCAS